MLVPAKSGREARFRLQNVWNQCKSKMVCEAADEDAEENPDVPKHRGCGRRQPTLRMEGLKITAQFKTDAVSFYSSLFIERMILEWKGRRALVLKWLMLF